jgi:hypothetical protein
MKNLIRTFSLVLFAVFLVGQIQAQTVYDVTQVYLDNSGFDSDFDYTIYDTGNVAQEIRDVKGWTKNISVNYTITGVYQLGTPKTFNGASVPAVGQDGTSDGGVLALSTGWNQSMLYYQNVTLPPGQYALVSAWFNCAEKAQGRSRVGWRPKGHAMKYSGLNTFPIAQWITDTVYFEVTEVLEGMIQIGFHANDDMGSNSFAKPVLDFVKLLRDTPIGKTDVDIYKKQLLALVDQAVELYADGSGNHSEDLLMAIQAAQTVLDNDDASMDDVKEAMAAVTAAMDNFLWENPTGPVPVVVTDSRYARGSTMAFGRMSIAGVPANMIAEKGFCWSEQPDVTFRDNVTSRILTNNGDIYWLENLKPATKYYMRAYAVTTGRQVAYGDVIRFYTLPKGQISLNFRSSSDAEADKRIKDAAQTAINWWNNLTEIKNFSPNIGYNPGTPTAECSYGGWMSVGPNTSYQRPGTIMHEMLHGIGVIPWADTEWSRFNLRSGTSNAAGFLTGSGYWLGDRVTEVLRFLDNSSTEQLNGDYQHMWPYGINGAQEDNGSDLLYIGNALVCQALGEDGLQHTNQCFAEPYFAFDCQDDTKYYIKCEDTERGLYTSYLMPTAGNTLVWKTMTDDEAAANDSVAWFFSFTPGNQFYQIRNAATNQYLSYSANGFKTVEKNVTTALENFQLMRGRVNVESVGKRGFWFIHPTSNWSPACLQAEADGTIKAGTFDISNAATSQRWLILTQGEMESVSEGMLATMKEKASQWLERAKGLVAVPHTEDVAGADATINAWIAGLESSLQNAVSTAEIQQYLDEVEEALFLFLCQVTPTDVGQPFDLTYLVKNPGMDATDGWSLSPTVNYSCAEFYERLFDFNQTIDRLPAGTYQWRAKVFQRPGRASECNGKAVTAFLYAGTKSARVAHIMDGAQQSKLGGNESYVAGVYIPNDMLAASIYFGKGLYESHVTSTVAEDGGKLKVGVISNSMDSYYWVIFDDFRLCYFGSLSPEEVDGIKQVDAVGQPVGRMGVYTLDGRKLLPNAIGLERLPRGLYIVNGKLVAGGH